MNNSYITIYSNLIVLINLNLSQIQHTVNLNREIMQTNEYLLFK